MFNAVQASPKTHVLAAAVARIDDIFNVAKFLLENPEIWGTHHCHQGGQSNPCFDTQLVIVSSCASEKHVGGSINDDIWGFLTPGDAGILHYSLDFRDLRAELRGADRLAYECFYRYFFCCFLWR